MDRGIESLHLNFLSAWSDVTHCHKHAHCKYVHKSRNPCPNMVHMWIVFSKYFYWKL